MAEFDLILRNAFVNGAFLCDIGVKDSIITSLGLGLVPSATTKIVECNDAVVTPGGVDGHVHLSQDRSAYFRFADVVGADNSKLTCDCANP
jgi:dihydropyrimidinase